MIFLWKGLASLAIMTLRLFRAVLLLVLVVVLYWIANIGEKATGIRQWKIVFDWLADLAFKFYSALWLWAMYLRRKYSNEQSSKWYLISTTRELVIEWRSGLKTLLTPTTAASMPPEDVDKGLS